MHIEQHISREYYPETCADIADRNLKYLISLEQRAQALPYAHDFGMLGRAIDTIWIRAIRR